MKTTYTYKNKNNEAKDSGSVGSQVVDTYLYLRKESDRIKETQEEAIINGTAGTDGTETVIDEPKTETKQSVNKQEKKKGKGTTIAAIVVLGIVAFAGYNLYKNKQAEKAAEEALLAQQTYEAEKEEAVESFEDLLSTMFTDETATVVKALSDSDFELLRSKSSELAEEYDIDTLNYNNIINTAEQYLKDKEVLAELSDTNLAFGTSEFSTKLDALSSSVETYSSESLKGSMELQVNDLMSQSDNYFNLRSLMQRGILDGVTPEAIGEVGRPLNVQELSELYKLTQKGIEVSQLKVALDEANAVLYDEDGNERKLSKSEKATAKENIESATEAYNKAVAEEEELRNGWVYISDKIFGSSELGTLVEGETSVDVESLED